MKSVSHLIESTQRSTHKGRADNDSPSRQSFGQIDRKSLEPLTGQDRRDGPLIHQEDRRFSVPNIANGEGSQ
jgi:hypothetical protein